LQYKGKLISNLRIIHKEPSRSAMLYEFTIPFTVAPHHSISAGEVKRERSRLYS